MFNRAVDSATAWTILNSTMSPPLLYDIVRKPQGFLKDISFMFHS